MPQAVVAAIAATLSTAGLIVYILVLVAFKNAPNLWAHSFFKLAAHLAAGDLIILMISLAHWIPSLFVADESEIYRNSINIALSTIAHVVTWYIYLTTTIIAINRLIGLALHPITAKKVIKDRRLPLILMSFVWIPLLASVSYFGINHCHIIYYQNPFHFQRNCTEEEEAQVKTYQLTLFGYIMCFICLITATVCYGLAVIFYMRRNWGFTILRFARLQRREVRLCCQGASIAFALSFEYFCSYMTTFYPFPFVNQLFLFSLITNSSVNPWVLITFNNSIRQEVCGLINRIICRREQNRIG